MKELIVETEKIKHNLDIIRNIVKNDKKIIAVVKGNGYGLDLVKYTKFLSENGVGFFAVATVEEALELREAGINEDILMMSSTVVSEDIELLIKNNIILTIGSKESGNMIEKVSKKLNFNNIRVHLKIDTGFGRYGFLYLNKKEIVENVKKWKNIKIEGIFSHFSLSFYGNGKESEEQYNRFIDVINYLKENGINPNLKHICNSSAILRFPNMHLNSVRVGSALLGRISIPNKWGFQRVGYLKSNVAEIKTLPKGYNIGYSNSYKTKDETKIAIIPCGYADGFNTIVDKDMFRMIDKIRYVVRSFKDIFKKQNISVEINGEKCNVLGRLGMFHVSVDITNKNVNIGDEVKFKVSPMLVDSKIVRKYI